MTLPNSETCAVVLHTVYASIAYVCNVFSLSLTHLHAQTDKHIACSFSLITNTDSSRQGISQRLSLALKYTWSTWTLCQWCTSSKITNWTGILHTERYSNRTKTRRSIPGMANQRYFLLLCFVVIRYRSPYCPCVCVVPDVERCMLGIICSPSTGRWQNTVRSWRQHSS